MGREVNVFLYGKQAGILRETQDGYQFDYLDDYHGPSLSISLPVEKKSFPSSTLHPFFLSLAPEGWLKERYATIQQLDSKDTFGILIANGSDLLGAVTLGSVDLLSTNNSLQK
jgi:serine/threonine-protein kinase HipA